MRIVLLYPPPWKIRAPGEGPDLSGDGPPVEAAQMDLTGDFRTMPYGLMSLAAQAIAAGHEVKTLNLTSLPWIEVEQLIGRLEADVFGMTSLTSNRRGLGFAAQCIRDRHPRAHIAVGGPHATALPAETLLHHPAVDTVVIGEGERTFEELIGRLETGEPTTGIAGTAWRDDDGEVQIGPPRPRIKDLDSLVPVHEHFPCYILLTSRGCPNQCTFCAGGALGQRRVSFHSVDYVLDSIEKALAKLDAPMLAIKDDTFTVNRRRAMEICQGILDRKLNFLWSCDTRADAVDEELLLAMRRAGCQRICLGVESGSPEILKTIKKNVTTEQILAATQMAKKAGLAVHFYMMAGNRGETGETFRQSLAFINRAQPNEFIFCVLSVFPGTEEFDELRKLDRFLLVRPGPAGPEVLQCEGKVTPETFFDHDFVQLSVMPDASPADATNISHWLWENSSVQNYWRPGVGECLAVLELLPDLHAAHLDLGAAYAYANRPDEAAQHVRRAIELGFPLPSLALNYLACIAGQQGDVQGMKDLLRRAAAQDWSHPMVAANLQTLTGWLAAGGPKAGPLNLTTRHDLEIIPADCQPVRPGPLPPDCHAWPEPAGVGADTASKLAR